ncbi:unnamed protein product, partial [Musa acuminata subsp. burmannicoides]
MLYDVDIAMATLEEFLLQGQSPATSPPKETLLAKLIDGYIQEIARDKNL